MIFEDNNNNNLIKDFSIDMNTSYSRKMSKNRSPN